MYIYVYMYMHICIYIFTYTCTYIHTYIYRRVYIDIYIYMYAHIFIYIFKYIHVHTGGAGRFQSWTWDQVSATSSRDAVLMAQVSTYMRVWERLCVRVYVYVYVCVCAFFLGGVCERERECVREMTQTQFAQWWIVCHITLMDVSCHTNGWVISHWWMSHVTQPRAA